MAFLQHHIFFNPENKGCYCTIPVMYDLVLKFNTKKSLLVHIIGTNKTIQFKNKEGRLFFHQTQFLS